VTSSPGSTESCRDWAGSSRIPSAPSRPARTAGIACPRTVTQPRPRTTGVTEPTPEISASLARGETVKLSSFGSFGIRQKGERVGRNPKTGEEVPIHPRRVLTFRSSHLMRERVAQGNAASRASGRG